MYVKVKTKKITKKLTIDDEINFIINNTQKLDINKDINNITKKVINKEDISQDIKEEKNKEISNEIKKNKNDDKNEIENRNKDIKKETNNIKKKKGSNCSKEGTKYEISVYNIVKKCHIGDKIFNTQEITELGGSKSVNDLLCNFNDKNDLAIEIKKFNTPDWMQCSLKYDKSLKCWRGGEKNKIPNNSKIIFENVISHINLFNNKIPPFMEKSITYEEWTKSKKETTDFNDCYIDCPNDTIKKLYSEKGCKYIQISEFGLYHLGEDICNFNVPEFICEQQLRIRIKVHSTSDKKGFCKLSVTISAQPKNIKSIIKSNYSLDDINKLPTLLKYE